MFELKTASFSFPFQQIVEMGLNLNWKWLDYFQGRWYGFSPYSVSQKERKFPTIEHGTYPIEQGDEFSFNMAILLWSTLDSIFKFHPHHFGFADPFKINIFSGIITA